MECDKHYVEINSLEIRVKATDATSKDSLRTILKQDKKLVIRREVVKTTNDEGQPFEYTQLFTEYEGPEIKERINLKGQDRSAQQKINAYLERYESENA